MMIKRLITEMIPSSWVADNGIVEFKTIQPFSGFSGSTLTNIESESLFSAVIYVDKKLALLFSGGFDNQCFQYHQIKIRQNSMSKNAQEFEIEIPARTVLTIILGVHFQRIILYW